jgi:hypothetical protein
MDAIFTDYLTLLEDARRDESTLANNRLALRRLSDWLTALRWHGWLAVSSTEASKKRSPPVTTAGHSFKRDAGRAGSRRATPHLRRRGAGAASFIL